MSLPAGTLKVAADLVVSGQTLVSPLTFSPGATPLRVGGASYHGELLVVSNGTKLQVVNALGLESYVLGVVGREMPSSWPAAALETQAVAARSYALAELENVVTARAYDLYNDDRSQVYGGIAAESPPVTAAVRATARQVVLYGGKVATTYFSSSSGGRTVSAGEAWGKPIPYLVSVADPYDTLSPYHDWGPVLFDARKAAAALKVPGALQSLTLTPSPSGRVGSVNAVGANGDVKLTASDGTCGARIALDVVHGRVARADSACRSALLWRHGVACGCCARCSRVSRWRPRAPTAPGRRSRRSRLPPTARSASRSGPRRRRSTASPAGDIRAALLKVAVAPLVSASLAVGMVQGSMKPALSGAAVQSPAPGRRRLDDGCHRHDRRQRRVRRERGALAGLHTAYAVPRDAGSRRASRSRFSRREQDSLLRPRRGPRRPGARARVREHRAACGAAVVSRAGPRLELLASAAGAQAGQGRGDRLRDRLRPPGVRRPGRSPAGRSSPAAAGSATPTATARSLRV